MLVRFRNSNRQAGNYGAIKMVPSTRVQYQHEGNVKHDSARSSRQLVRKNSAHPQQEVPVRSERHVEERRNIPEIPVKCP